MKSSPSPPPSLRAASIGIDLCRHLHSTAPTPCESEIGLPLHLCKELTTIDGNTAPSSNTGFDQSADVRNAWDRAYVSMTVKGASARSAWGRASAPTSAARARAVASVTTVIKRCARDNEYIPHALPHACRTMAKRFRVDGETLPSRAQHAHPRQVLTYHDMRSPCIV